MVEDFTTIEHDFLHTKDYFNNYKFTYKERKSKLDFFQNINNSTVQDTTPLMELAKSQLVEVKKQYKEMDAEIRRLSQEIHVLEQQFSERGSYLSSLQAEEEALKKECENLGTLDEKLRINESLNVELDVIEAEIKSHYARMDESQSAIVFFDLDRKRREEEELRMYKQELAAKQKRLTVINTESYIEDIYCWHKQLKDLLESIFGVITVETVDSRVVFRIALNGIQVEAVIGDRKVLSASISGELSESVVLQLNECRDVCIRTNNLLLFLAYTFLLESN
ncbi:hypothetical protein PAEPH01_0957 [Pancytospora epiphaga]|nr:hypothetical protein PAEPH01_0957 [Pancytospora epiphaga]